MKTELLKLITGDVAIITYLGAYIFVFMGLVIKWYIQIRKGVKTNPNSPDKFNLNYFIANNLFTKLFGIFASIIITFVALRFSVEIFNIPLSMFFAFLLGISFDFVIDKVSAVQNKLK